MTARVPFVRVPDARVPGVPATIGPMAIIVFQHAQHEGPGRLGLTLRDHGFKLDIRRLDQLAPGADPIGRAGIPSDLDNVHGILSLGGPQNIGDAFSWLDAEARFLKAAHERQLPVIGICLGAQLIAHALGGKVGPMGAPGAEFGFDPVAILPPGQTETMLAGVPWNSMQFHVHGQEVKELPPGAQLLASSAACRIQAFRAGLRTYAFQYHFELDMPQVEGIIASNPDLLAKSGRSGAAVQAQASTHYSRYALAGDRQCVNIAAFAFPFRTRLSA